MSLRSQSLTAISTCFLCLVWLSPMPVQAEGDIDAKALLRADTFLKATARGKDILSFVHFGSNYRSHVYQETRRVARSGQIVPGEFALIYRYRWEADGSTDLAFLCDAQGAITDVQVVSTNAILNQPYLTANATIQVLGRVLIEAFKESMTQEQHREIENLVTNADAEGLLEWSLKFQQAVGK